MKSKVLDERGVRLYLVVFDAGDEVADGLLDFARENGVAGASFTGIGAFEQATLAFFDLRTNRYEEIPVREQVEVLALTGNLALHDGEPKLHAHVVIGMRDGAARGGHLLNGIVRPTLEVSVTVPGTAFTRVEDAATRLPLLDPDA